MAKTNVQIPSTSSMGASSCTSRIFSITTRSTPATRQVVRALERELAGLLHSKATIRFSYDDAIPTRLIARIAKLRAAEVRG